MKEKSIIYFKQSIKYGYRYGWYFSFEDSKDSILTDVVDIYLDVNTGHYSYVSKVERINPYFDDLIEISVSEYEKVERLYNVYHMINSQIDESFIKLNYVHKSSSDSL